MSWFPDMFWLIGEWILLLCLSALVGLFVGWFVWRRPALASTASSELSERAQARTAAAASSGGKQTGNDSAKASPSDAGQDRQAPGSAQADAEEDNKGVGSSAEPAELSDLVELRAERDALKAQRNSLRSQLSRIESLVGDAELSRGLDQ